MPRDSSPELAFLLKDEASRGSTQPMEGFYLGHFHLTAVSGRDITTAGFTIMLAGNTNRRGPSITLSQQLQPTVPVQQDMQNYTDYT